VFWIRENKAMKSVLLGLTLALVLRSVLLAEPHDTPVLQPLGIALESYSYPYPVHLLQVSIQGQDLRMAYMDAPPESPANGRTVVLLHGKNFGGYYFGGLMRELCAAGYRVIAPDQIGWGKSSKPDIRYSFQLLAANTAHLLDTLHVTKVVVLGHSTGGMLAVRFALMYPERVSQLILEDPIGLEDYRTRAPAQSDETLYQAELRNTDAGAIRAFYAHYFASPRRELYEPLADVQIRITSSGEYPRWAKASALAYQMIYQQPVCYEYRLLQPPTLIVVGEQDHTAPFSKYATPELRRRMGHVVDMARKAAEETPHGSMVVIPDCGHIPHIERPDEFKTTILRFLNTNL
jgi:Predicted hydrolases or acyltransferases (alpha/beta hydrolase superfamily)